MDAYRFRNIVLISVGCFARNQFTEKARNKKLHTDDDRNQAEIKHGSLRHSILLEDKFFDGEIKHYTEAKKETQHTEASKNVHRAVCEASHEGNRKQIEKTI